MKQKGFAHIFLILFLLAGLAVAVYLVQQKTNILPKAYEPVFGPIARPTPAVLQSSTNTSDPNAPTFIKINFPNGGENFKVGDVMHITWSSNNLNQDGSCIITLAYDDGSKSSAWVPVNTPNGFFDWKLTVESGGRKAKVDMDCYDYNENNAHDQSDNFFTVTAQELQPAQPGSNERVIRPPLSEPVLIVSPTAKCLKNPYSGSEVMVSWINSSSPVSKVELDMGIPDNPDIRTKNVLPSDTITYAPVGFSGNPELQVGREYHIRLGYGDKYTKSAAFSIPSCSYFPR